MAARASDGVAHVVIPFIGAKLSPDQLPTAYAAYGAKVRGVMRVMRTELGTEGADIDTDPLLPLGDSVLDFEESAAQGVIDR